MDYTAAKRMAAFRRRMREKGFKSKQIWVDTQDFPGAGGPEQAARMDGLDQPGFLAEIAAAVDGTGEAFRRKLYGELAAYARGLRKLWDYSRQNPSLFNPEDLDRK